MGRQFFPGHGGHGGLIQSPDDMNDRQNRYKYRRNNNKKFEEKLCQCIIADRGFDESMGELYSKNHVWRFPFYGCGSWAADMWDCAIDKWQGKNALPHGR